MPMINQEALSFDTNDDGDMLDDDGDTVYCDAEGCEAPAQERVVVSVNEPHDDTRNYCCACNGVYEVGVQHGRYHEAARHGDEPGRDSSQDPPQKLADPAKLTTRQRVLLNIALSYLYSNVDDANDTFAFDEDDDESEGGKIRVSGVGHDSISEEEVMVLRKLFDPDA